MADDDAKNEIIKLQKRVETQSKLLEEYREKETSEESQLASGDEEFVLHGNVRGRIYTGQGDARLSWKYRFEVRATWNSVIKFIRSQVGTRWTSSALERAIHNEIKTDFTSREMDGGYGLELPDEEVDKIIVQFSALGLIRQRGTVWELSGKGVSYVSRLLATRKGQSDADYGAWCAIEWLPSDRTPAPASADEEW